MDKVKIGFSIEYEDENNIVRNGLFLREPEIKELEKRLKEINKITDLKQQCKKQKEVIDKAIEYINKYGWQEDIIGGIYTTTGKPVIDRYMRLEWDNCNELLEILKGDSND